MTVWKAIVPEAGGAAQIAVALVKGDDIPSDLINQQVDNKKKKVPSVILKPVAVTDAGGVNEVIKGGDAKASEVCTGRYASACKDGGIEQ
jgi:D-xylose transport system substrate-binding protein